jgi:exonuclease SbcC
MIDSLEITNFQAHKKTKIDFGPTITTIVGRSDIGKSAIIRALQWVMQNKQKGNSFVRHGAKSCKVCLTGDFGTVVRTRTGRENTYVLNEKEYKAFGSKVPEDIERSINTNDINFQLQYDSPFWLSQTGGEISRQLNSIIDLSEIDEILKAANSEIRKQKTKIDIISERIEKLKKQKLGLKGIKQIRKEFLEFLSACESAGNDSDRLFTLEELLKELTIQSKQGKMPPCMEDVVAAFQRSQEAQKQVLFLQEVICQLRDTKKEIKTNLLLAKKAEKEFTEKTQGKICPMCHNEM